DRPRRCTVPSGHPRPAIPARPPIRPGLHPVGVAEPAEQDEQDDEEQNLQCRHGVLPLSFRPCAPIPPIRRAPPAACPASTPASPRFVRPSSPVDTPAPPMR